MLDRLPKVVARFTYTGPANRLRTRLGGAILNAIRPQYLALRSAVELEEKIKIIELGLNQWEYYPKVVTTRPFTDAEFAQVEAARQVTIATLLSSLAAEGATNIVIHSWTPTSEVSY